MFKRKTTPGSTSNSTNKKDRKSTNVVWCETDVTKSHRNDLNNQQSAILWFTGLSGSGKSTVANAVEQYLHKHGIRTYILDGDNVRHGLNGDLSFSEEDRKENIRRIGEVSKLFIDAGVMVLTSFISPFIEDREFVRGIVDNHEFIEVYIKCPIEVCEQRDVKGLYQRARAGEIKQFTGIDSPYEAPESAEIIVDTSTMTIGEAVASIVTYLENNNYIQLNKRDNFRRLLLDSIRPRRPLKLDAKKA